MIQSVESLEPEFQLRSLSDPGHLEEGCVEVPIAWSVECVSAFVPKGSQWCLHERRSIQEQLIEGGARRRQRTSEHVHAFGAGGISIQHGVHSRIYRQHVTADVSKDAIDLPALSEPTNQPALPGKRDLRQERREEDLPVIEIRRSVLGCQVEGILWKGGIAVQRF